MFTKNKLLKLLPRDFKVIPESGYSSILNIYNVDNELLFSFTTFNLLERIFIRSNKVCCIKTNNGKFIDVTMVSEFKDIIKNIIENEEVKKIDLLLLEKELIDKIPTIKIKTNFSKADKYLSIIEEDFEEVVEVDDKKFPSGIIGYKELLTIEYDGEEYTINTTESVEYFRNTKSLVDYVEYILCKEDRSAM